MTLMLSAQRTRQFSRVYYLFFVIIGSIEVASVLLSSGLIPWIRLIVIAAGLTFVSGGIYGIRARKSLLKLPVVLRNLMIILAIATLITVVWLIVELYAW